MTCDNSRFEALKKQHDALLNLKNEKEEFGNGIYDRYIHPVVTAGHIPLHWRYDLNPETNPYMMELSLIHI